jgi:hypothetical protein
VVPPEPASLLAEAEQAIGPSAKRIERHNDATSEEVRRVGRTFISILVEPVDKPGARRDLTHEVERLLKSVH